MRYLRWMWKAEMEQELNDMGEMRSEHLSSAMKRR
jgi:hypothetical protein